MGYQSTQISLSSFFSVLGKGLCQMDTTDEIRIFTIS